MSPSPSCRWPDIRIVVPGRAALYVGHVLEVLRSLPTQSIHSVITSPPYFRQRRYGCPVTWPTQPSEPPEVVELGWEEEAYCGGAGTAAGCGRCYLCHLVLVFREVHRVLRDDGTLWLVLDDKACARGRGKDVPWKEAAGFQNGHPRRMRPPGSGTPVSGIPLNGLVGLPFRVAMALQNAGWVWRAWAPWIKRCGLPSSMTSRWHHIPEVVSLLTKVSSGYYYDAEAVRVPHKPESVARAKRWRSNDHKFVGGGPQKQSIGEAEGLAQALHPGGRSRRASDWMLESMAAIVAGGEGMLSGPDTPLAFAVYLRGWRGKHEATFPVELAAPMVRAGAPTAACAKCGAPHVRQTRRDKPPKPEAPRSNPRDGGETAEHGIRRSGLSGYKLAEWYRDHPVETLGFAPSCACGAGAVPAYVLDPFSGAASTGVATLAHGAKFLGIEAVGTYVDEAAARLVGAVASAKPPTPPG